MSSINRDEGAATRITPGQYEKKSLPNQWNSHASKDELNKLSDDEILGWIRDVLETANGKDGLKSDADVREKIFRDGKADLNYLQSEEEKHQKRIASLKSIALPLLAAARRRPIDAADQLHRTIKDLDGWETKNRRRMNKLEEQKRERDRKNQLKKRRGQNRQAHTPLPQNSGEELSPSGLPKPSVSEIAAGLEHPTHETISDLQAENRKLKVQNTNLLERPHEQEKSTDDRMQEIRDLRERVRLSTDNLRQLGEEVREPLISTLCDVPVVNSEEFWALHERQQILERICQELEDQKQELLGPSLQNCQSLIQTLQSASIDTEVYEWSLNVGNVGAVLIVQRILRNLVAEFEDAQQGNRQYLRDELDSLEQEVMKKILDVRLKVVPSGMIRFARDLLENAPSVQEARIRNRTVEQIIELVAEYMK